MQKIINDPSCVVDEMLQGFVKAHQDIVSTTENERVLKYKACPVEGKVGIVTGGGSVLVEIYNELKPKMHSEETDVQKGYNVVLNSLLKPIWQIGDNMNVAMAMELAEDDGIKVGKVVANDDVPSSPKETREKRRGVAGEILMWKVGGAKAAMGGSLDEVLAAAQKAIDNTRSMGVGLSPCTIPEVGHPNFTIEPGYMEVGIGHHGEPGIEVAKLETAGQIAKRMCDVILPDLPFASGDEVVVLVSGLGSTPLLEQYIFYGEVEKILTEKGIKVHQALVGNYFTSLEMAGITLTLMKLDDELKECFDLECNSVGLTQYPKD